MSFAFKTRDLVLRTRNCVFKMMNFAGGEGGGAAVSVYASRGELGKVQESVAVAGAILSLIRSFCHLFHHCFLHFVTFSIIVSSQIKHEGKNHNLG